MKRLPMTIFVFILLGFPALCLGVTTLSYTYDGNGNMVSGEGKHFEYNDANQLIRVRQNDVTGPIVAEYFYDYNGQRVKKIENGITTYYIGKYYERQVKGNEKINTIYINANDQRVAKIDSFGQTYYYHSDHLGSTNAVTDVSGTVIESTRYYPFGEIRKGGGEKYSYTGKEKDLQTNWYYYEARYYNPQLKHFTQADSVDPDYYDPQDLNKYAYARNNAIKNIDTSGNNWIDITRSTYKYIINVSTELLSKVREQIPLNHIGNVTQRLTSFASKTLTVIDVFEKASDTINYKKEVSTRNDTRLNPQLVEKSNQAISELNLVSNIGSFGLSKLSGGVGTPGAAMLGSQNLVKRDASRLILDAQKAKNLVDVFSDPNATEDEIRAAENLYNNPVSSPLFPR